MFALTVDVPLTLRVKGRAARGLAVSFSLVLHLGLLLAVIATVRPTPLARREIVIVAPVELIPPPPVEKPTPKPPSPATPAAQAEPAKASAAPARAQPTPFHRPATVVAAAAEPLSGQAGVSDGELAGAVGAGGGGGGSCDMPARLQAALRRDPLVRAAATEPGLAGNHAIRVWNGDWVQSGGEDGKGLQAVREAILWEVGFSPAACRAQPVRGLIRLSLGEGPGSAQLILGTGAWRWSDLLSVRR